MSSTSPRTDESAASQISTAPTEDVVVAGMGFRGWSRWAWRQLTSMRTALLLLFLLALGSIPGSVLPQRPVNPEAVTQYLKANPGYSAILDRFGFFDVFGAPWYVAIYLLLIVSLIGCIVPRIGAHWRATRMAPPKAPSRLTRMPEHEQWSTSQQLSDAQFAQDVTEQLRGRRWRTQTYAEAHGVSIAAEKGYLREVGNLLFHISVVIVLVSVAVGGMFGWRGQALIIEGESFSNTLTQYDSFKEGRLVDSSSLPPFSVTLNEFSSTFEEKGEQRGAPRTFEADVNYTAEPGAPSEQKTIQVNDPLVIDGTKMFLIGHGYAPVLKVTNAAGKVVYDAPTVFLPSDGNFTSNGVVKMPDVDPQLGLQALFLPTAAVDAVKGPHSTFPALDDPALFVSAWKGNLGLDNGVPQSVYALDTASMKQLGIKAIRVGESWTLPDGLGTVTMTGVKQYATFDVAYDPTQQFALAAAVLAIAGLMMSLFIPRRRVWVRLRRDDDGDQTIELGALSRTDESGLRPALDDIADGVREIAVPGGEQENPGPTDETKDNS